MKKIYFWLVVVIIFNSCDEKKLGDNYFYLPDYEAQDIGFPYGSIIYQSQKQNSFSNILVYAEIVKVKQIDDFILVKQKPNIELYKKYINEITISNYSKIDSLFYNDVNYFIINKRITKVSKAYNIEDFKKECKKQQIDTSFIEEDGW